MSGLKNVTLEALQSFARAFVPMLQKGDVILLNGDLGVGKTSFTRACLNLISNNEALEVPSPTFTIVQTYEGAEFPTPVLHMDLYRTTSDAEVEDLGLEDLLSSHISFVEWPKLDEQFWGNSVLEISINMDADGNRSWKFEPKGTWMQRLPRLFELQQQLDAWGYGDFRRVAMQGDASSRRYEMIEIGGTSAEPRRHKKHENGTVLVLMDAPPKSDEGLTPALAYSKIAKLADDQTPFVAISKALNFRGFSAPKMFMFDIAKGTLILENLGTQKIIDDARQPIENRYIASAEALAKLHGQGFTGSLPYKDGIYQLPAYDLPAMMAEVDLFLKWGVKDILGVDVSAEHAAQFKALWAKILAPVSEVRETLVLRDFHSPNVIWCEERAMPKTIGMIDFQDGLHGACAYDVASLGQDARVDVNEALETALIQAYAKVRLTQKNPFHMVHFMEDYAVLGAQRATKILGIFSRLQLRDNKPHYKAHQPRVWRYLKRNLAHAALAPYKTWLIDTGLYAGLDAKFS